MTNLLRPFKSLVLSGVQISERFLPVTAVPCCSTPSAEPLLLPVRLVVLPLAALFGCKGRLKLCLSSSVLWCVCAAVCFLLCVCSCRVLLLPVVVPSSVGPGAASSDRQPDADPQQQRGERGRGEERQRPGEASELCPIDQCPSTTGASARADDTATPNDTRRRPNDRRSPLSNETTDHTGRGEETTTHNDTRPHNRSLTHWWLLVCAPMQIPRPPPSVAATLPHSHDTQQPWCCQTSRKRSCQRNTRRGTAQEHERHRSSVLTHWFALPLSAVCFSVIAPSWATSRPPTTRVLTIPSSLCCTPPPRISLCPTRRTQICWRRNGRASSA